MRDHIGSWGLGLALLGAATTGCTGGAGGSAGSSESGGQDQQRCEALDEPLGAAALRPAIESLADPALDGRAPGTEGDKAARAYIEAAMRCAGLEAPGGSFQQAFDTDAGAPTANVIGVLRGSDPEVAGEIIVIGAHHDHLGASWQGVFAGANDDASGVAMMLGLARHFAARTPAPARTLVFVAFGAEEEGFLGSERYLDDPPPGLAIEDTVFMLNLDMVGRYEDEELLYALHTFPGTPGREVLEPLVADFPQLNVSLGEAGSDADHLGFCAADIPVTFFFTDDLACYHQTCDLAERIDYTHLAMISELGAALITRLADPATAIQGGCGEP